MNCQQGDLAVFVRSWAGNEGKVVRCVRFMGMQKFVGLNGPGIEEHPAWEIDRDLPTRSGRMQRVALDTQLRPLRDNDGEDEILRFAGKPHEVTA
jgi:hypothetical protein